MTSVCDPSRGTDTVSRAHDAPSRPCAADTAYGPPVLAPSLPALFDVFGTLQGAGYVTETGPGNLEDMLLYGGVVRVSLPE